jgi:hypothetical protein
VANPTFKAVEIQLHPPGGYRTIGSAIDAAEALLDFWPADKQHGIEFELACIACLEAVDLGGSGETVRQALLLAAKAADMMIRQDGYGEVRPERPSSLH